MNETDEIQEGFLCPMCMKDFGTQMLLQSHFVEAHSIGYDQTKTGQNVKGIIDKAKRKILGRNEEDSDQTAGNVQVNTTDGHLDFSYWEPQDIGKYLLCNFFLLCSIISRIFLYCHYCE